MTEQLSNFLSNINPWVTLISFICGILGLILAIYFGVNKRKKIFVSYRSNELIKKSTATLSKMDILYDGKSVPNVTVTKVKFWNGTFPTINNSDLIDALPFTVSIENGTILEVTTLEGSDTPNVIDATIISENTIKISFDYLDKNEGGVIQIIHTGHSKINISNKIKGGKILVQKDRIILYYFLIVALGFISCLGIILIRVRSIAFIILYIFMFIFFVVYKKLLRLKFHL